MEKYRELIKEKLIEEKINQRKRGSIKTLPQYKEVKEVVKDSSNPNNTVSYEAVKDAVDKVIDQENKKANTTSSDLSIPKEIKSRIEERRNNDVAPYGYKTIINNLVRGLQPEKKDGKRYRASNIDIKQSFKDELHSGNYLYNVVHVVPAIIFFSELFHCKSNSSYRIFSFEAIL